MTLNITKNIKASKGFTIVELLIVIVIIGILAAITIVAYNGIQQRAKDSSYAIDASNIDKKSESFNANGTPGYPTASTDYTVANLADLPSNVGVVFVTAAPTNATQNVATDPTANTTNYAVSTNTTTGKKTYAVKSCGATVGLMIYYAQGTTVKSTAAGTAC